MAAEKATKSKPAAVLELSEAGVAFIQNYLMTVESGKITLAADPAAMRAFLAGYDEIRSQLPRPDNDPS